VLSGHDTEERVRLRPRDESMSQTVTWRLAYVIRAFPLLGKLTYSVAGRLVAAARLETVRLQGSVTLRSAS
jgi:hypothetical protein